MGHLLWVIGHWLVEGLGSREWAVGSGDLIFDAQAGQALFFEQK